jgi:tripartite-type tricarboxylate transporter receptor subunit TctC
MLPQVPTLAETVAPGLDASVWQGIVVPAGTPADVVAKINRGIAAALAEPDVKSRMEALGMHVAPGTPDAFGVFLAAEIERWHRVARKADIQPE